MASHAIEKSAKQSTTRAWSNTTTGTSSAQSSHSRGLFQRTMSTPIALESKTKSSILSSTTTTSSLSSSSSSVNHQETSAAATTQLDDDDADKETKISNKVRPVITNSTRLQSSASPSASASSSSSASASRDHRDDIELNSKNNFSIPSNSRNTDGANLLIRSSQSMSGGETFGYNAQNMRSTNEKANLLERIFLFWSYLVVVFTFPLSLLLCFKVVQEYERAVIFRLGKLVGNGAKGPGLFFVLPCIDDYSVVDLRTITFDVPPQEVLTKDSVTVLVDAVVYYRIWLPTIAVSNVYDYGNATRLLTSTTLRNVLGTKTLSEVLSERENISISVRAILDDVTKIWGVKVERVEMKDVRLPVNFQRLMAVEAEAVREARAKIIASEGEKKASHGLLQASQTLSTAEFALPLRYMQNLQLHAEGKDTTIFFPVPIPMLNVQTM